MKETYLEEFEEMILLMVGVRYDEAYGLAISREIEGQAGRAVHLSAVHSALHRLEKKGLLSVRLAEATPEWGGKRKRLFRLTPVGSRVLQGALSLRNELFGQIPRLALEGGAP